MNNAIKYRDGYKYQLAEPYVIQTAIRPDEHIGHDFIVLSVDGVLMLNTGYAWDGCSGPTYDDSTNMRAGLVHDALFQLMRNGFLDSSNFKIANNEFKRICIEDGMNSFRVWYYYLAVSTAGKKYSLPQQDIILTAP